MYLIDTNIFLEILLLQEKHKKCKSYLLAKSRNIFISDFSLHSIGVILFKKHRHELFKKFIDDMINTIAIVGINKNAYVEMIGLHASIGLDFDDLYQYLTAKQYGLTIVTMDMDFKKLKNLTSVVFL